MRRAAALLCLCALACGGDTGSAPAQLSVFAASSLTEAFDALARRFEDSRGGRVRVVTAYAGSQVLRMQIGQGAAADVFASADAAHLEALAAEGLAHRAEPFARNRLVLVVPAGATGPVGSLSELPRARRIVLGGAEVPVGRYAREVLRRADVAIAPGFSAAVRARVVSEEPNARLVRAKVALGEADAALVYRTDARESDAVRAIPLPPAVDVAAEYRVAVLRRTRSPALARDFVAFLRSEDGQATLVAHGFSELAP